MLDGVNNPGSEIKLDFLKPGFAPNSEIFPTKNKIDKLSLYGKFKNK